GSPAALRGPRSVEFLARGPGDAHVVGGDGVAGFGFGAVALDEVCDDELGGNLPSGKSISGFWRSKSR
ncbi:hypothetical protein AHiyo6_12550, partial [Arthrobacter sp. Hiyo6]